MIVWTPAPPDGLAPRTALGIASAASVNPIRAAPTAACFLVIRILPAPPTRINFPNPATGKGSADRRP